MEPGRRRASLACEFCRLHKLRCSGDRPQCANCRDRTQDCAYAAAQRRRGPGKSKEYIRSLEEKLAKIEGRMSKQPENDITNDQVTQNIDTRPGVRTECQSPTTEDHTGVAQPASLAVCPNTDTVLSAHSSPILREMLDRMQSPDVRQLQRHFGGLRSMVETPMPIRRGELVLLEGIADRLFQELPLFGDSNSGFLAQAGRLAKSPDSFGEQRAAWECAVCAAVATTISLKTLNSSFKDVATYSSAFFKRAYAALPELLFRGRDIIAIQAILCMVISARNWAAAQMTMGLLSMAIRMMQMGWPARPTRGDTEHQSQVQDPDVRRLYQIMYVLDAELSTACGIPPQMGMPYLKSSPQPLGLDEMASPNQHAQVFGHRVKLAVIQSRINEALISFTPANSEPGNERPLSNDIPGIWQSLESWRAAVPDEVRPSWVRQRGLAVDEPVGVMRMVFYSSTMSLHWLTYRSLLSQRADDGIRLEALRLSRAKCDEAARLIIHMLLDGISPRQFVDFWRMLRYPFAAALVLASSVIERADSEEACLNHSTLLSFVDFVRSWADEERCDLAGLLKGCSVLARLVETAMVSKYSVGGSIPKDSETFGRLVAESGNPIWLAQGLMSDLTGEQDGAVGKICEVLGVPIASSRYGGLVPELLRPETYAFTFDSR